MTTPWTESELSRLRQMIEERREFSEISKELNRTAAAVAKKSQQLGLRKPSPNKIPWNSDEQRAASVLDFPTFQRLYPNRSYDAYHSQRKKFDVEGIQLTNYRATVEEIEGDALICACVHVPQTDPVMWNKALAIGERDQIPSLIVAGDIVTGDMFSKWETKEDWDFDKELESLYTHLVAALSVFQSIYITPGNHVTNRITKISNGHIRLRHLIEMTGLRDAERERIFPIELDYLYLHSGDEKFIIGHASSYSRIDARVPLQYAEKEESHVITGNGHRMGHQVSRSGRWHAWDLGMMADDKYMGYVQRQLTSYPRMMKSFATVRSGAVRVYGEGLPTTDWVAELQHGRATAASPRRRLADVLAPHAGDRNRLAKRGEEDQG